jgi:rubredoxin
VLSRIYDKNMGKPLTGKEAKEYFEEIKSKREIAAKEAGDKL